MLKRVRAQQSPNANYPVKGEDNSPYIQPFRHDSNQHSEDASSTGSRRRILKRTRNDSSSNSKERRLRTDSSSFQVLSMKKLEDIIKTVHHDSKQQPCQVNLNASFESTKEKPKSAMQCSESINQTQSNSYKYLRSLAINPRPDINTQRKVIDCKVRPGTPRKEDDSCQSKDERRLKQLQRTVKDQEEQIKQYHLLRLEHEQLELKCQKDAENIGKLVDKVNQLNRQKDAAQQQVRNLRLQVSTCKKVTLITTRSDSSESAIKERQNKELANQISKLKQDLARVRSENVILRKSKEQYEEQIIDYERNYRARLDQQVRRIQTDRQRELQARIEQLRKEIQLLQNHSVHQNLRKMEEDLTQTRQLLKNERVSNHCLQRQLQQLRRQSSKKIEASTYNQLRQLYSSMMTKYRQYVAKHNPRGRAVDRASPNQQLFQLTPEK